jgi:class 3 adenylate cyclase/tetratricopeptide (TPR) repeat protein
MDVGEWLASLGLAQYAQAFRANDIDAETLPGLTSGDLKELGVASLGHRKKILAAAAALNEPADRVAPRATTRESAPPRHLAERILRSRAALEGERKQVTVLFADIRGSLELIENVDPEEASRLLDPAIEAMMAAVHRYEGTVNKVLGDGVMALFGAPIAHEDHAVRACFAALAMQAAATRMAEGKRRRYGELQMRVGLNSGEVVVRTIGNDLTMDYDAIGATTHLAARMEQLAPPGTVRLTGATVRLAEGFIQTRPLGAVPVRGLSEAVEAFELVGASDVRSRFQAVSVGGFTRFVGRETELDALGRALVQAGAGRGQVVAVVGEPGVGKSRLYYEFTRSPRTAGWLVLESGSVSHGKATAFLPILGLLRAYFGVAARDDPRTVREKVVGKLLALDESLRVFEPPLLALFEVPPNDAAWAAAEPAQRRRRTLAACRALLLREAQVQPLVVVFEDLHWIDAETQAFLDELVDGLAGSPILLLLNFRPEYRDHWSGKSYYTRLRVDPLPPQGASELLDDLLGRSSALQPLRELLIGRTEGNPFFLEESVRALVENGALIGERGARTLAVPVATVSTPPSVQTVLAARIDRLDPQAKRLLQTAAVIGKDFSLPLLLAASEASEAEVQRLLSELQAGEFVYETRLFPDPEYTFKHALTHDVAYGSLLGERRRALHSRIVSAMEQMYSGRRGEAGDRMAFHALRGELWEKAFEYAREAGFRARALSANRSAVEAFRNALTALARLPQSDAAVAAEIDLHFEIRDVLFVSGDTALIPQHVTRAEQLAQQLGDLKRLAGSLLYRSGYHWSIGEHQEALRLGEQALALVRDEGDAELLGLCGYRLATAYCLLGDYPRSAQYARLGVESLRGCARQVVRFGGYTFTFCCSFLALALAEMGEFEEAEKIGREGFELARSLDHGYSITVSCFGIAHALLTRGLYEAALPFLREGLAQHDVHDILATLPWVAGRLAFAYAHLGEEAAARQTIERVMPEKLTHSMLDQWFFVWSARAALRLGDLDLASSLAARVFETQVEERNAAADAWARWAMAEIALRRGDAAAARERCRTAASEAERLALRPLLAHCRMTLGRLQGGGAAAHFAAARELALASGMQRLAEEAAAFAAAR